MSKLHYEYISRVHNDQFSLIPFEHRRALEGKIYYHAQSLDADYRTRRPKLLELYRKVRALLDQQQIDVLAVDTDNVYHPEFLRSLGVYTVLLTADDPTSSYARTVPYVHAFDHVGHVTPLYNERVGLKQFLLECGAKRVDLRPWGVPDYCHRPDLTEDAVMGQTRDIDVVFVGGYYPQKSHAIKELTRRLKGRLVIHGQWGWKSHVKYFMDTHSPIAVRPIRWSELVSLYQRSKIGINIHTDDFSLGNLRLYQLPANGVMQISDCKKDMHAFYEPNKEVATYDTIDECIEKVEYYLGHDAERREIARLGYRRTMTDYTFGKVWEGFVPRLLAGINEKVKNAKSSPVGEQATPEQ